VRGAEIFGSICMGDENLGNFEETKFLGAFEKRAKIWEALRFFRFLRKKNKNLGVL
jgi:hypothetical protein